MEELGISHVDWIKIDVEGAEFEVIEGLRDTLKKHSPRLIVEITDKRTFQLMKELDYTTIFIPSRTLKNYYCEKCESSTLMVTN